VRYVGVDTPEIDHQEGRSDFLAHEARQFNAKLVQGKQIRLEFDQERNDHHGRLLAYVFLENGDMVNEVLVKKGFARVLPKRLTSSTSLCCWMPKGEPWSKGGIWQKEPERPERSYIGNSASYRFHRPTCSFGKAVSVTSCPLRECVQGLLGRVQPLQAVQAVKEA